jgi:hypothetical protein
VVSVLDQDGAPIPDEAFEIRLAGGASRRAVTDRPAELAFSSSSSWAQT